jgi:hypothetical protein
MRHLRSSANDTAIRVFMGRDTTQRDIDGRPAVAHMWYWEPIYHDGGELFSGPYPTPQKAAEAFYETI